MAKVKNKADEAKTAVEEAVVVSVGDNSNETKAPIEAVVTENVSDKVEEATVTTNTKDVVQEAVIVEQTIPTRVIHSITDHTCTIGGVEYRLTKGREQTVPADVARILAHANKAIIK